MREAIKSRDDHRVITAREKRRKMHARLLDATAKACSKHRGISLPLVEEVIAAAGVSRGTFYNYFDSTDQAAASLGLQLAVAFTKELDHAGMIAEPGLKRMTQRSLIVLIRAGADPVWGLLVHKVEKISADKRIGAPLVQDLKAARGSGDLNFQSLEVATDLVNAATNEGVGRLSRTATVDWPYILELSRMIFAALGVSKKKADAALHKEWQYLQEQGSLKFSWWRDPS